MIKNETKTKSMYESVYMSYNLKNKKVGSKLECPVTIYKDGIELTQAEYDIVSNSTEFTGPLEIYIDFSKLAQSNYGGVLSNFVSDFQEIYLNSGYLFNITTGEYETTLKANITSGIANYVSSDFIFRYKLESVSSFSFSITVKNNKKNTPSKIVADLEDKYSILLQGVHTIFDTASYGDGKTHSLIKYSIPIPMIELLNFNNGIPSNATTVGLGALIDSTSFPNENLLKFGNKGINSSTAAIAIPIVTNSDGHIEVEFFVSTENEYDIFNMYLDSVLVLSISGNAIGNTTVHSNKYPVTGISAGTWSKYLMTNVKSGNHNIKFEYVKDSSDKAGKDNIFIKRITTGTINEILGLEVQYSNVNLLKNNLVSNTLATKLTARSLSLGLNKPIDILLTKGDGMEIKVLKYDGSIVTASDASISAISGREVTFDILSTSDNGHYSNCLLDAIYIINKELTDLEKENILRGTQVGFKRPRILTGAITPSASYKLTGSATLYINDGISRVVTGDFTTTKYENNIVLDITSECIRA